MTVVNNNNTEALNKVAQTQEAPKKAGVENALLYAVVLLMEAVTVSSKSSVVRAKSAKENANEQQKYNDELKNVKWEKVPLADYKWIEEKFQVGTQEGELIKTVIFWFDKKVGITKADVKKQVNKGKIREVEMSNMRGREERQRIQNELSILQLRAKKEQTNLSTTADMNVQQTREASVLLNMLKSLTDKILLPRGEA